MPTSIVRGSLASMFVQARFASAIISSPNGVCERAMAMPDVDCSDRPVSVPETFAVPGFGAEPPADSELGSTEEAQLIATAANARRVRRVMAHDSDGARSRVVAER